MTSPAVVIEVCIALIKRYLPDYQGCPRSDAGWSRFAEALQLNSVSVEHAEAILQSFDEDFPTVRQIHDVAAGLRPQFEPKPDQQAEWEKKYGKPEAFDLYPADELAMHWQAFRDILYYTEGPARDMKSSAYWEEAMSRAIDPKIGNHGDSIAFIRNQAHEMGWAAIMALKASPVEFPYRKPQHGKRDQATKYFSRITQADIQRAEQSRRETTAEVDSRLDGWDDPDR